MRKRIAVVAAAAALLLAPFGLGSAGPAHAMTCTAQEPIDLACDVLFYVVGSACNGRLPVKPPTGPIALNTATSIELCPPLG